MRVAGRQPLGLVLPAGGRERRESSAYAVAGRAVHADAVLALVNKVVLDG